MRRRGNPNWVKSVSGNPGGRSKKLAEVKQLAQAHTADAIKALATICTSGTSESARVAAAVALLDRGHGKPVQTVNANVRRSLVQFTDEELAAIAAGGGEGDAGEEESAAELQS